MNVPSCVPATYAVETYAKRRSAGARPASSSTRSVPRTLMARASSSGRSNETEAAAWMTSVTERASSSARSWAMPSPGAVRSAGTASTRPS